MLIRQHCPVTSRCPGYRHPPAFLTGGESRQSLVSAVNRQLREKVDPLPTARPSPVRKHRRTDDLDTRLAARMSAKLEEGDLK